MKNNIRNKKAIDGKDREILRVISSSKTLLSSRQIGQKVNLSGSAIIPRLNNLKLQGILKSKKTGIRTFNRQIDNKRVNIKSPRSIFWDFDLVKSKRKRSTER